jgi:hypothetical protein
MDRVDECFWEFSDRVWGRKWIRKCVCYVCCCGRWVCDISVLSRFSSAPGTFRHDSNVGALVASIVPNLDICDASRAPLRTARVGVRVSALCARNCFVDESMPSRVCHSVCLRDFDNLCYQLSRSISRPRGPFIIRKMVALFNIQLPVVH